MGNPKIPLERIDANRWRIPQRYNDAMHVAGIVYASDELIEQIMNDNSLQQVVNVATLPGIVGHSLAMPDIHWGYGFPVGGVAATHAETGVISPGGIGFDINCGVRLLATDLLRDQIKGQVDRLADELFNNLPSGVGTDGMRKLTTNEMREVMVRGSAWAIEESYGVQEDLEVTEENGCLAGANPDVVSQRAIQRGTSQLGSLGSGNHFCEVQMVDHIYDEEAANVFGIGRKGQIVITIHCGSRGFGHQIAEDYIKIAEAKQKDYGFTLVDRQLACMPLHSEEGQAYLGAMSCAANFAWANRQLLMYGVRQAFAAVFGRVLAGAPGSMEQTFGTTCHGAGRQKSRTAAKKAISSKDLLEQLEARGVTVRVHSKGLLAEEAPQAYKDAQDVVNVVHNAGLSKLVVRLKPVIVVKG